MLQEIRERAQGWIAWFIVILISVPFALWGIQSYMGGGSEPVVASVNGYEITEREFESGYREYRQRLRQQLGNNYRPELIDEARLRAEVLDSMIRNQLVLQASEKIGLGAGQDLIRDTIRSIPAFQVNGVFNSDAYSSAVRAQGLTPAGFEAQVWQAIVSGQLSKAISGSEFATSTELKEFARLSQQQRELSYLLVPASEFLAQAEVSDEAVRSYYESNQAEFMAPERVKVEYLDLDVGNIAKTLSADDELLLGYYEQHKTEYETPEQRRASHILFSLEQGAGDEAVAAARATAMAALERARNGEDFASLAKQLSQDPGSADLGGDLGFFESGVMDPAFDEVVFALQEGEISEPVQTPFGFHLIKLTAIRPTAGKSFEQAKDEVRSAYLKNEAGRLFYEYAERLSDLAYEDPDSLQPAAEALGMELQTSDWFDRQGGEGILVASKLVGAAFSDDVLREGHNSEAIEIGPEHIVVARVTEHEEAAVRPFESVREEIRTALQLEQAAAHAQSRGKELLSALRQGGSLEQLTAETGWELVERGPVTRDERESPAAVMNSLFRMPRPEEGKKSFGEALLVNGDFAVIVLGKVTEGSMDDFKQRGGERAVASVLTRTRGDTYFRHMLQNLRDSADIRITKREE